MKPVTMEKELKMGYQAVCFTGHRPKKLGGWLAGNPTEQWVREVLKQAIAATIMLHGTREFICGGALGVDWWAAEEVLAARQSENVKLTLALPFKGYMSRWPVSKQNELLTLAIQANEVVWVSEPPYHPGKMQIRNEWMVDHTQAVIAVWNGNPGGTANCVNYAAGLGRPIYLIDPSMRKVGWM